MKNASSVGNTEVVIKPEDESHKTLFLSLDHSIDILMTPDTETIIGTRVVRVGPRYIKFIGPYYLTADKDEIEYLRAHASFGHRLFEGAIPDDQVRIKADLPLYVCSINGCDFTAYSMHTMKQHKQSSRESHRALLVADKVKRSAKSTGKKATKDDSEDTETDEG